MSEDKYILNNRYRGLPGNEDYNTRRRQRYQENREHIKNQILEARYNRGDAVPMEMNKLCTASLGVDIGEYKISKLVLEKIFESVKKMDYRTHGYDFICKYPKQDFIVKYPQFKLERGKECKIDAKTRSLSQRRRTTWNFDIDSDVPDYFIFNLMNNREYLNLMYCLLIHKNEVLRGRELWNRDYLYITNKPKCLLPFKKFNLVGKIDMESIYKTLKEEVENNKIDTEQLLIINNNK